MDYLHFTRGYTFSDAEYISKNSPRFVESLVSMIDEKDDAPRSLRKFFRILSETLCLSENFAYTHLLSLMIKGQLKL
ncbi:hypothetical protein VIGAN_03066600 [Vigna angularis var. angularis]|uniref:Uncharacterized protein n=1 Tax=Vigna angularis var. angularis TaxID=157739 RepID=A0A0S3RKH4_PHAAN|nr:hypothetical protein VIGAN_03066600 [Vigna angularis var. angularis]